MRIYTVNNLFFDCVVARQIWVNISERLDVVIVLNPLANFGFIIRDSLPLIFLHLLPCGGFGNLGIFCVFKMGVG
jgi:hypothetical protein